MSAPNSHSSSASTSQRWVVAWYKEISTSGLIVLIPVSPASPEVPSQRDALIRVEGPWPAAGGGAAWGGGAGGCRFH